MELPARRYSEPLGLVIRGELWETDAADVLYVDVKLRVDDEDGERGDLLDLRLPTAAGDELILNVPRVDLLRALELLGQERANAIEDKSDA